MSTEAMQTQRGRCLKCGQRWVCGQFDEEAGQYGEFYCAACWDSWDQTSALSDRRCSLPEFKGTRNSEIEVFHARVGVPLRNRSLSFIRVVNKERMEHSTGCSLWTGSRALLDYMQSRLQSKLQGVKVLELGAGCGLPGMGLAQLGAEVILTDCPQMCRMLGDNVAMNFTGGVPCNNCVVAKAPTPRIASLRWGHQEDLECALELVQSIGGLDFVIGSEIIYDEASHHLLIRTCEALLSASEKGKMIANPDKAHRRTRILMSCGLRGNEFERFAFQISEAQWCLRLLKSIDVQRLTGLPSHSPIAIVEIRPPSRPCQFRSAFTPNAAKRRQKKLRTRKYTSSLLKVRQ